MGAQRANVAPLWNHQRAASRTRPVVVLQGGHVAGPGAELGVPGFR